MKNSTEKLLKGKNHLFKLKDEEILGSRVYDRDCSSPGIQEVGGKGRQEEVS